MSGGMPSWNVYSAELKQNEQYWEDITFKTLSTNTRGIKLVAELVTRFWRQTEEQFIWKVMWHLLDLEQMQTLNTFFFSFFTSIHPRAGHKGVKHWARPSHIALTQVLHHIHTLSCLFFLTEKRGKATAKRASDINHYRCFPTEGISNSFGQWAGVCLDS